MHRRTIIKVLFGATLLLAAGVTVPALAATTDPPSASATQDAIDSRVAAVLAGMTPEQRVAQLFSTVVFGPNADTATGTDAAVNQALYGAGITTGAAAVARYDFGAVIYFTTSHNITADPQQVGALSNGLQHSVLSTGKVPLLLQTDQEGGNVVRLGTPFAVSPGNMAIGASFDPGSAYQAAAVTGAESRAVGITMDDAPVVDNNTNPVNTTDGPRSFGDNTAAVSAFSAAAVAGYQHSRVAAQAKHFPGLGATTVNTDTGIAVNNEIRAQILAADIPPFAAAVAAGVQSVMVGHVVVPALDPSGAPASLSQPVVTGLLRDKLRYGGVIETDALNAGALANIPETDVVLRALNAGDDMLLLAPHPVADMQAVLDAVAAGTISQARIDQSVSRILRMKFRLGLFDDPYTTAERVDATVGTPAHLQTMAGIAKRSITLLRNADNVLPLTPSADKHVLVTGWGISTTQTLTDDLAATGLSVDRVYTGSPNQSAIDAAVAAAQAHDLTVVTTMNVFADVTQQNLLSALLATGRPVVAVSVAGPYDIAWFPSARTYLAAYGFQPNTLAALTNVLVGAAQPEGHLPVTIHSATGDQVLFRYGSGIGYPG
ncbi:MAG: glycoside hydrolase family 3 C-terminal domain-containing protein [Micromonosporaceae bacterium]|nr:glycoside hydrolase family 3 C-terminal domain-containing protein [Micromonosporaceae bacterium]